MPVTFQTLTIFARAVEQQSFVKAARSLLIDPSAVSRAIGALEKDLGVVLFARSTRALKLTAEGARFHRDCIHILQRLTEATQRFRANSDMPYGQLRVGMAPGLRRRVLLQAVAPFRRRYPQIEIVLISVENRTEIGEKSVDVLVRARGVRQRGGARSEPQGLVVRKLFQSRYVVCGSSRYFEHAGKPLTPADLPQHPCIPHVSLDRDIVDEWRFARGDERQKFKFIPQLSIQGVDALCEAGLAGCGLIRVLAANVEDELRSGTLVPVLPNWECTGAPPMIAIYRKTRPMIPQVSVFVQHLADALGRHDVAASARSR